MTDLDKLIEAVELAALPEPIFHGSSSVRGHWAYNTGLDAGQRRSVFMAYNGSLDAANALHDALLPGWFANIWNQRPTALVAPSDDPDDDHKAHVSISSTPARAWLLAILKAYHSEVQP